MTAAANGNGYSRAGFYVAVGGAGFSMLAALVAIVFWVGGIASDVASNKATLANDERRMETITSDLRTNDLLTSNITRDLREVETQFCAADIIRNLMHASDLRTTSELWQKIYGHPFPTDNAYYPQICQHPTTAQ